MPLSNLNQLKPIVINKKNVFLRCDLNVPFGDTDVLLDGTKITRLIPTINYLKKNNAKIIIASHFGRPKGKFNKNLSLKKLIPYLEEYWRIKIKFISDMFSQENINIIKQASNKKIFLLENLRFYKEEEENDKKFAQELSKLAEIYINDAFACCHRNHASIDRITQFLPSYPGLLLRNELHHFNDALNNKKTPQMLIIGGKKISTKLSILKHLIIKMDKIIIVGAMANNFLKALGHEIGKSFYEPDFIQETKNLYNKYKNKIILPHDFVGKNNNKQFIKDLSDISTNDCVLDIGLNSCEKICNIIKTSKIVIWNGPIGFYEETLYAISSIFIARAIAYFTKSKNLISIIAGGDTVAIAKMSGLIHYFSYISTGGGAFLKLLEKEDLIGLKNLRKNIL